MDALHEVLAVVRARACRSDDETDPSTTLAIPLSRSSTDGLARPIGEGYVESMAINEREEVKDLVDALSGAEADFDPRSISAALRAVIAGGAATSAIASSIALFEAGGRFLLSESTKGALRGAAETGAERAFTYAAAPLLGPAALGTSPIGLLGSAGEVARSAAPLAARVAGKELLKRAGRAGGIGFALDGAIASFEAVVAVRDGAMDRSSAASHVAREAATGAAATGAGVLLGAGLVVFTGATAAPVVFAVAALGAMGAKQLLRRVTMRTARTVALHESPAPASAERNV